MPVFTARVPGVLKIGDRVLVAGKIKENARKFSVNLCAEEGDEPRDVVLHFDVRFHRDNIISLSRKNGTWVGSGSYDTNCNLFVRGTYFRIMFELKDESVITIYCQNKFHSNFLPKIPVSAARFLVVWADVERVTQLDFYMGQHDQKEGSPLPRTTTPIPRSVVPTMINIESNRSKAHNRPGMCANEYPRLQRSGSSSSGEEGTRRRSDTENTLTDQDNPHSENADSSETSTQASRTGLKKKGSLVNRAKASQAFHNVCHYVSNRRIKRHA